jgi:glycosyltransferase involved in cell wall biosynthesis
VVTVHDLTLVEHPEWHEPSKVRYFGHAISYAARHADRLICVSEHTARRLRERYSPACPVDVIPHGIDHGRFAPSEPSPGADAAALAPLALPERYGLFLGTLEPRKNLELLVEAFDQLAEVDAQLSLVLAGKRGWGNDALDRAISGARHKERIVELGYVEASAVPALLRKAAVVAYPSKEEGFGLPALEALACGTALVTTENSVMAELAGGAAWFCSGEDRDELAAVLEQALEQAADRREVGILRAASFSWERCAAQHVESYTAALD